MTTYSLLLIITHPPSTIRYFVCILTAFGLAIKIIIKFDAQKSTANKCFQDKKKSKKIEGEKNCLFLQQSFSPCKKIRVPYLHHISWVPGFYRLWRSTAKLFLNSSTTEDGTLNKILRRTKSLNTTLTRHTVPQVSTGHGRSAMIKVGIYTR